MSSRGDATQEKGNVRGDRGLGEEWGGQRAKAHVTLLIFFLVECFVIGTMNGCISIMECVTTHTLGMCTQELFIIRQL